MWSTTTSPHPASIAADRSASDLLLPWTITDSGRAPARSAAASSPAEAASAPSPSPTTAAITATVAFALQAYTAREAPG